MAYSEELAQRIRAFLSDEAGLSEKKMFGGLGFMLDGNMAVAADSQGGVMLRVDPQTGHELIDGVRIVPMEMKGRTMNGWLHVNVDESVSDEELHETLQHGVDYARSLPPK